MGKKYLGTPFIVVLILLLGIWARVSLIQKEKFTQEVKKPYVLSESDSIDNSGPGSGDEPTPTPTTSAETSESTNEEPTPTESDNSGSGSGGDSEEDSDGSFETTEDTVDRLAQVDQATLSCIYDRLNDTELNQIRYLIPETEDEKEELEKIKDKASVCFSTYKEAKIVEKVSSKLGEIPESVKRCLINAVGPGVFEEVSSGLREPTELERKAGDKCFEGAYKSEIRYQTKDKSLDSNVENCLKLALGDDRYDEIKRGSVSPSVEERAKVERCFGASVQPFQDRPVYKIPNEIESCLSDSIDNDRLEQIKTGRVIPSEEEREIGESCFEGLNDDQEKFLPPPPERVPFLQEDVERVSVVVVNTRIDEISDKKLDRKVILSGSGPANTIVDIYIFSDPVVVVTKTDENGNWQYELNQPLEGTSHVAYAVTRDAQGNAVRSGLFNFNVLAAEEELGQAFINETNATPVQSSFITYSFILIAVVVVIVIGVVVYYSIKNFKGRDEA